MNRNQKIFVLLLVSLLSCSVTVVAEVPGKISGKVIDKSTKEGMIAANIVVEGTSLGASTDVDGNFTIQAVPSGIYTIKASYIGYSSEAKTEIRVVSGGTTTVNFELGAASLTTEAVVITAQAQGQQQAVNKQLASDQIVNVVSSSRIQELPDANAAESVARLPGISVTRNGGEANQIVIRGMQPKYNSISIDGVRLSSTNKDDRSVDLSMISPNMLDGIEVSKTVNADQDADVLGGTVNFKMREARGEKEGLGVELLAQGGYNKLSDAVNRYNNYKYVGSVEGRFFDQKFGVFVQADLERKNLSSNEMNASYGEYQNTFTDYIVNTINLHDISRDRQRSNATVNLDYRLTDGKISLSTFVSSGTTYTVDRGQLYYVNGNSISNNSENYTLAYTKSEVNLSTNTLNYEQQLSVFHINAKVSHTFSEVTDPGDWTATFQQQSSGIGSASGIPNLTPTYVVGFANNNLSTTSFSGFSNSDSYTKERSLTGSIDIDFPLNISKEISSIVKFGGKYRYQTRYYNYDLYNDEQPFGQTSTSVMTDSIESMLGLPVGNAKSMNITNYIDPNFHYGTFLNGDYSMIAPLNESMMQRVADRIKQVYALIGPSEGYGRDNFNSATSDYSGNENLSAGYVMATIHLGDQWTIIPGVRFQDLTTQYTGTRGEETNLDWKNYNHIDTTVTVDHPYWLPDVNIRYKPFAWFDIRLSYTNTLAYPDYSSFTPRYDLAQTGTIVLNNDQLKPTRSTNYDAYCSFYENTLGLFTIGGFVKQIDDLIYYKTFNVTGQDIKQYVVWQDSTHTSLGSEYMVDTYVNDPYRINNYGLELEWQTHFWYLPHPLDGLVFNINYTHTYSEAKYPFQFNYTTGVGRNTVTHVIDTFYVDRLIQQPNNIVNLSVGYDYKGFSIRVSMLYQEDVNAGYAFWPQLRQSTASYKRWDLSVKQNLPFGLQLYADINNINGAQDISVLAMYPNAQTANQTYDMTADIGLRWQL
ncbi:MAG TPA: TonB-dependent receptor [Bacteroidota bacterium]|nr:TonB-dependent receptor [Bacteroidota bacterium]